MRVLVTGAENAYGQAIVRELAKAGHAVRVFGGDERVLETFEGVGPGIVSWFPGNVHIAGQIEPALSERQALVHAHPMDEPASGKRAELKTHVMHLERGARYARFGAEREQVDHFILVTPGTPDRRLALAHENVVAEVRRTRGVINVQVVTATSEPEAAGRDVARILQSLPELGKQPGRENDAVTA
ncbi:MAG TPA: hypothetical protein VFH47_00710 [Candidatus Thermoplasmatota archaeon]|nr:hypothetical protein [Candidatus Thermoplasmatota archaeon]